MIKNWISWSCRVGVIRYLDSNFVCHVIPLGCVPVWCASLSWIFKFWCPNRNIRRTRWRTGCDVHSSIIFVPSPTWSSHSWSSFVCLYIIYICHFFPPRSSCEAILCVRRVNHFWLHYRTVSFIAKFVTLLPAVTSRNFILFVIPVSPIARETHKNTSISLVVPSRSSDYGRRICVEWIELA